MNIEKFHKIASLIKTELERSSVLSHLNGLVNSLNNVVSNPVQQHITQFNQSVLNLRSSISSTIYTSLGSSEKHLIDELEVTYAFCPFLIERIDEILQANTITYQIAQSEITPIFQRLNELNNNIQQVLNGLNWLNIHSDKQRNEFAIQIPRAYTHENLEALSKEMKELNFILRPFFEINGGTQEDIKVNSLASSEYTVYVALLPSVAISIAKAVDKTLDWFEKLSIIKKNMQGLRENGVEDDLIEPIILKKTSEIDDMIRVLSKELIEESGITDPGRKRELEANLSKGIKKIAERIDNGFSFDLSIADDAIEDSSISPEKWNNTKVISQKIRMAEIQSQSILHITYE